MQWVVGLGKAVEDVLLGVEVGFETALDNTGVLLPGPVPDDVVLLVVAEDAAGDVAEVNTAEAEVEDLKVVDAVCVGFACADHLGRTQASSTTGGVEFANPKLYPNTVATI